MFNGKTIMITGGSGSFGNAALRRFLKTDAKEIRIFSRDEKKQDDMRKLYNNSRIKFHIGDVRDIQGIRNAIGGVDYIFNAAALKQVPSCEFFPMEAVKTNILGTENVLTAAIEAGIEKVVCLSTDKAAYPINAMGMSKALMERVFIAKSRTTHKTVICGTRYGNVMCSRGSVIPLFVEQIKRGESLTVTDPEMTRFLMSLDEAVDLVLYAFENGAPGDLFVQKSPACTIGVLAQAVKEIFCSDVDIQYIGHRHGEKKYETLLTKEEYTKAEDLGRFFKIPADNRDLNYLPFFETGSSVKLDGEYNSDNTERLDVHQVKETLLKLEELRVGLEL